MLKNGKQAKSVDDIHRVDSGSGHEVSFVFNLHSTIMSAMASILRQLTKNTGTISSAELGPLNNMIASHRQFMLEGGRLVVQIDTWQASCSTFLTSMEAADHAG